MHARTKCVLSFVLGEVCLCVCARPLFRGYRGVCVFFLTFFNTSLLKKIHTCGTRGHAGLVHSTLHKSYKHGMNEHAGKRKVDTYPKTI